MSFNANDINLRNYEEYFILYMDNELTVDQKKMVDSFLRTHPHLQAELEMLLSTKLPAETFSFNKEALLAGSMTLNAVDEELLLYIDNELTTEKKKVIELELQANTSYQLQHQHLLQTKLDASEVMAYPNKKELYRKTERVVAFKSWMRIAAAVVVIAAMGVLYFAGNHSTTVVPPATAEKKSLPLTTEPGQQQINTTKEPAPEAAIAENIPSKQNFASQTEIEKTEKSHEMKHAVQQKNDLIANNTMEDVEYNSPYTKATTAIAANPNIEATTASFKPSKEILNNSAVTSALSQRNTTIDTTTLKVPKNDVADSKGSFKSFLRKATRLIERKTGIDPTSGEEDELLIGAVAVKLK